MSKIIFPAVAVALISASTLAFGAATSDTNTIKSIDAKAPSITLDDGNVFRLAKSFKVASLKLGEKVTVTDDMKGTDMVATTVVAAK